MTVEPGVINAHVTAAVAAAGYFYAPDPSSQSVCTIGGNVAENSGGAHCLKYGFTVTHVLALDVVLPDGSLVYLGSRTGDSPGYDLAGVFVGSEGTLGIATRVVLRIVKQPQEVQTLLAAFPSPDEAGAAVSAIIAAGILPAAVEMMDRLSIQAAEAAVHPGYPGVRRSTVGRTGRPPRRSGVTHGPGANHLPRLRSLGTAACPICRGGACWSGRAAKPPSPRWAASRPTTSCKMV